MISDLYVLLTGSNVLEVTVTVPLHSTPETKFEIVSAFVAAVVPALLSVETTELSNTFFTATSIVTPSLGKGVEVIFTLIACVAPIEAKLQHNQFPYHQFRF